MLSPMTMISRHRYAQQPVSVKGGDSSIRLPTVCPIVDDGSKVKAHRSRYGATFTISQVIVFAAASASVAAVLTAYGASHYLMNRFEANTDSVFSLTTVTHTMPHYGLDSGTSGNFTAAKKFGMFSSFGQTVNVNNDDYASLFEGRIQEPLFLRDDEGVAEVDDGQPKVVWLMSFPNSGTSFTLHLTRESSNTTTATNYALEGDIKDQPSIPALETSENGPFLEMIPDRFTNMPKYILTKTHCGGFCSDCKPKNYVETPRSFQISCQSGMRAKETISGLELEEVTYNASLVKKAVHVIRHPLDNIVARFHLFYQRFDAMNDTAFTTNYPYNSTGFHKWCVDQDSKYDLTRMRWVDQKLADTFASVPCHVEFFRYIQWHNLAFTVSRDMGLPTLIIHYDDYSQNLDIALKRLLTFLELPKDGEGVEFSHGKEYRDYYTPDQRAAVLSLIKEQSTAETWHYLKDYNFS